MQNKLIAAALFLAPLFAFASEEIEIIGTIPNKDGGRITFTARKANCPDGQMFNYTQSNGGKIELVGCYRAVGDQLMVVWADGDVYTYPINDVTFSPEFMKSLKKREKGEKPI